MGRRADAPPPPGSSGGVRRGSRWRRRRRARRGARAPRRRPRHARRVRGDRRRRGERGSTAWPRRPPCSASTCNDSLGLTSDLPVAAEIGRARVRTFTQSSSSCVRAVTQMSYSAARWSRAAEPATLQRRVRRVLGPLARLVLWTSGREGFDRLPDRRPGDPVPEPHLLPRLGVPDADACRATSASSARPSTWTRGRPSTSSRRWA